MALTVPNTFVAGTTAVASEVNDNFVAVKTFVDGLETDVTALETKSPVITLAGDLTGSATLTNLGNATLTATIAANSVALGTDTTGNYVSNVTAGTGVTVTHTPGEGSSAAVAIDGTVVTLSGTQTLTNKTLTSPTITGVSPVVTLSGDVTGSATLTNLGSATITATIAPDSVALGTDTTGNYVSTITAGTGITGSASSESATPTIAIDAAVVPQLGVANTFTTNQIISGSTSSALLRITQTGAGNALTVEDDTNPDSTPTIIDNAGRIVSGTNLAISTYQGAIPQIQAAGSGASASSFLGSRFSADSNGPGLYLNKSRSATISTQTAVVSGDRLGNIYFNGTDGTSWLLGAAITGEAEGTISTGVVPGRLLFFTASSAGTITERMRINSDGEVGIGAAPVTSIGFRLGKQITGATNAYGMTNQGVIQSDVTSSGYAYYSGVGTQATTFSLGAVIHYGAIQGTFGVGSTVTEQVGFLVSSGMTGATNNYGFRGLLPAAANRFNLLMDGTAGNYLAGRLGVGAILTSGSMAQITNTTAADNVLVVKGAAAQSGYLFNAQNSAGASIFAVNSSGNLDVGQNIGSLSAFMQLGSGRTADGYSYIDFVGDLTYSDYGLRIIRGNTGANSSSQLVHRGTGDLSLFTTDAGQISFSTTSAERMRIDSAGNVGIGSAPLATSSFRIAKNFTGGTVVYGTVSDGQIQSDVTTTFTNYFSGPSTQATAFTLGTHFHFRAETTFLGAGSSLTNHFGFSVGSSFPVTATLNAGFHGAIPSGTGRYNLYINGTADNYLAGRLGVGATLTSGAMTQFTNTTAADKVLVVKGATSQTGYLTDWQNTSGTSLAYVDSSGNAKFVSIDGGSA